MKRHPALVPLSHEHHHNLSFAQRLRRACLNGDEHEQATLLDIFRQQYAAPLEQHFQLEEAWLVPHLEETMKTRLLAEHRELRELAATTPSASLRLVDALIAHVRFEERELFPWLEQHLSVGQLTALKEKLG